MDNEKIYMYETHLHTSPVSKCARSTVRESLEFYKEMGYAGVFITNHFIDGNIDVDPERPYEERVRFFLSDYEEGVRVGKEIGLDVFFAVESSYKGTDFLIFGLDGEWYLSHPEIEGMKKTDQLSFMASEGAYIVQAHPYREASYIDHIRLFPRHVHGVEVYNAGRTELENSMAEAYAKSYGLSRLAGSDNHEGPRKKMLGGMKTATPIADEADFISRIVSGEAEIFVLEGRK